MAQVMARHLHKRRRLSQLLARLVVTLHSAGGVAPVAGDMEAGVAETIDAAPATVPENVLGPAAAIDAVNVASEMIAFSATNAPNANEVISPSNAIVAAPAIPAFDAAGAASMVGAFGVDAVVGMIGTREEVGTAGILDAADAVTVGVTGSLNNNFYYPPRPPQWPLAPQAADDAPLDLSLKPEPGRPAEVVVSPSPVLSVDAPSCFPCDTCGETFEVRDRLAKHISCRHRTRGGARAGSAVRAFICVVCGRRFARSDMLTRHARLHSGVKPYACGACGQVFSRSDHLATHQRTHTGEKPYRCPSCPYAACRRDMITRHMRTHTRRPQPA